MYFPARPLLPTSDPRVVLLLPTERLLVAGNAKTPLGTSDRREESLENPSTGGESMGVEYDIGRAPGEEGAPEEEKGAIDDARENER